MLLLYALTTWSASLPGGCYDIKLLKKLLIQNRGESLPLSPHAFLFGLRGDNLQFKKEKSRNAPRHNWNTYVIYQGVRLLVIRVIG